MAEKRLDPKCSFCRQPRPTSQKEADKNIMKRIEANDPVAVREMGKRAATREITKLHLNICRRQLNWVPWIRIIICQLCIMMEELSRRERKRKFIIWKRLISAMGGHVFARNNLGCTEWGNAGSIEQ